MGLVTRRSEQLDKLFDKFAFDPKKKQPKDKKENTDLDSKDTTKKGHK